MRLPLTAITYALVATALVASCVPASAPVSTYTPPAPPPPPVVALASVERPQSAKQRYGPSKISTINDSGVTKYSFEDSLVSVVIFPGEKEFDFVMVNKTDHTVKLVWDDAAIVGIDGTSDRVIHAGVKYTDKARPQAPSVIVRRGKLSDLAAPAGNISWVYNNWYTAPLIPRGTNLNGGRQLQLLLPLEIEGVENEYLFTFSVTPPVATVLPVTGS